MNAASTLLGWCRFLHYDGTPITARFIANAIGERLDALKVTPLRKVVS
jgi:2-oxoglutarate ferredoxin oxidoreductase subunit alpha